MPDSQAESELRPQYSLVREIAGSFLGRASNNSAVLIVPTSNASVPVDRATGDVILSYRPEGTFELNERSYINSAAVIQCVNADLASTFEVLAQDIAGKLKANERLPTPLEVSRALSKWEELLRNKRQLSVDEEIGLWGELWTILNLHDIDMAVSAWRGPDAEYVDFVGGGIGVECKASRRRLEHFVSQDQLTRPLGDLAVFVMSLWVSQDQVSGQTINEQVAACDRRLQDRREFEEKLLSANYSRADAPRYKLKLRVIEAPLLVPSQKVPRVRAMDAGVSRIRFMVSLEEASAVSAAEAVSVLARLCTAPSDGSAANPIE